MKMTVNDLYRVGVNELINSGVADAEFDARCLLEFVLDIDTTRFMMIRSELISDNIQNDFSVLIKRRIDGEPLQYILGKWEFMGNEFYVGDGVLIPRPETEMLVELAKNYLQNIQSPIVVDFCSGSGCIAVSVAKLFPEAKVYAVEKYGEAYSYLQKNIELNKVTNVKAIKGDLFDRLVLNGLKPDLILSNPPYIRTDDIENLETEVKNEPHTALDGGNDGYDFYRFLTDFWFGEFLDNKTAMMVECAEDQGDAICSMFSKYTSDTKVSRDFNGLQRVVVAYK